MNNLEEYKKNCRKRICEYFTIDKMIDKMNKIFEEVYKNPNKEKILNGKNLSSNINITKELITINLKNDEEEYKWECIEYEKKVIWKTLFKTRI